MISPDDPTNIDEQQTDLQRSLIHWVGRCCRRGNADPYYLTHRGVALTVHPARAAYARKGDRQVMVAFNRKRHKNRGWLQNLTEDIDKAITMLEEGGGAPVQPVFGDRVRDEITRRKGTGQRSEAHRDHWVEWLLDDELPLLMGSWCYHAGLVTGRYHVQRQPKLDFHLTNDELATAAQLSHGNLFVTLKRLARERMLRAGALTEE